MLRQPETTERRTHTGLGPWTYEEVDDCYPEDSAEVRSLITEQIAESGHLTDLAVINTSDRMATPKRVRGQVHRNLKWIDWTAALHSEIWNGSGYTATFDVEYP